MKQILTDIHGAHAFTQPVGKDNSVSSAHGAEFLEAGAQGQRGPVCVQLLPPRRGGWHPKVCVT